MGCKFGFKKLPEDLLNFPHRKWLDHKVQQFLVTIGLIDGQEDVVSKGEKDDKENVIIAPDEDTPHSSTTDPPSDVTDNITDDNDTMTSKVVNDGQEL